MQNKDAALNLSSSVYSHVSVLLNFPTVRGPAGLQATTSDLQGPQGPSFMFASDCLACKKLFLPLV